MSVTRPTHCEGVMQDINSVFFSVYISKVVSLTVVLFDQIVTDLGISSPFFDRSAGRRNGSRMTASVHLPIARKCGKTADCACIYLTGVLIGSRWQDPCDSTMYRRASNGTVNNHHHDTGQLPFFGLQAVELALNNRLKLFSNERHIYAFDAETAVQTIPRSSNRFSDYHVPSDKLNLSGTGCGSTLFPFRTYF